MLKFDPDDVAVVSKTGRDVSYELLAGVVLVATARTNPRRRAKVNAAAAVPK
jgi:hypothetical protein